MNVLLAISYVIMLALYAHAFGSYAASFLPKDWQPLGSHILLSAVIVLMTLLNAVGSRLVGEAEEWIVGLKIIILLLFVAVGFFSIHYASMAPSQWTSPPQLAAGGMIIFLAYEGFELIANTADDVADAGRTLPRAYFASVIFVIALYIAVSMVTVGNLSVDKIVSARDYALAEAAKPFLGQGGFIMIAIAAMLSTGSAINATLYGAARVSYIIAKDGELPAVLEHNVWHRPIEGLLIIAGLTLIVANVFNLSSISLMGSAGFLIAFAAVNIANVILHKRTKSMAWLSALGAFACVVALAALIWQRFNAAPQELWVLVGIIGLSVGVELVYRLATGRQIKCLTASK